MPPHPPSRARPWRRAAPRLLACAGLLMAISPARLHAQHLEGRITGPNGEPVAAALVHVASASPSDTTQAWTRSGEDGRYALRLPPGGPWTVRVQRIGFAPHRATLSPGAGVHDAVLSPRATLLDPLRVRGSPAAVRAVPGGPGGSAASRRASTLEWTTATPGDLGEAALLAAGTIPVNAGDGVPGVSIAGQAPTANHVTADGASWGGASLPSEAVKSVGVVAETYDVARGQFMGGQIAATTHSGTGDPGGALRLRIAGHPADVREGRTRSSPDGVVGLLSGAYGMPVVRDRLFVFGAAQGSWQAWDMRALAGNRSALRQRGLDPDSVRRLGELVTDAGFTAAAGEQTEHALSGSGIVRLDWKPSPAHDVGVRYDDRWSRRPLPGSPTSLSAAGGWQESRDRGVLATAVSRRGGRTNELRVYGARGWSHTRPDGELPTGLVGMGVDGEGLAGLSFGGGQQTRASSRRALLEANDVFRWTFGEGAQRLQAGGTLSLERAELESAPETFGTFYFEDLRALEEARPASYSRRLTGFEGRAESRYAAVFAGHTWQASPALGVTWGLRMEHLGFGGRGDFDPAVAPAFPGLEHGIPSRWLASPRFGFHYLVPHPSGTSRLTVRGGVGRFVGRVPLEALAFAAGETGTADETLVCVGEAAPEADWERFGDPAAVPTTCRDGAAGSGAVRTATAFAPDFSPPRLWRASLHGEWQPIARFRLALGGTLLRGDGRATARDLNLPDGPAFTLDDEGGRGVFAPAAMIEPTTGLVPPLAGRPHGALGTVRRIGADARSGTTQVTGSLMYVPRGVFRIAVLNYTYTRQWDEASALSAPGGALPVAGTDPRALLRGPGDWERRHAFQLTYSRPFRGTGRLSLLARLTSGAPYTPLVAGDVNGDGVANDAAFVFDPRRADPSVAAGMARLLDAAPAHARDCLRRQLGRMAGRNACRGPWTASLDAQALLPVGRRLEVSVHAANLPSLADYVWNRWFRGEELSGWGRAYLPDPTLLRARGFDADRRAFRYEVNGAFGEPLQRRSGLFAAFSVTLQARLTFGTDPAEQWIVADVRRERGFARPVHELRAAVAARAPNLPLRLLQSADSLELGLAPEQVRALTLLADSVQLVLPPLLDSLAAAAHRADTAAVASSPARFRLRAYTGIAGELLDSVQGQVRAVLRPDQWSRVPPPWREPSGRSPLVPMKPLLIASEDVW